MSWFRGGSGTTPAAAEDAEDPKLWQDDWDDDDVDDDFCRHLREELQKPVEKN